MNGIPALFMEKLKNVFALQSHGTHVSSSTCVTSFNGSTGEVNATFGTTIPSGAIMWFYLSAAPDGWKVCDGTNGTPNLLGKYPLGANSDIGGNVAAGLPLASLSFSGSATSHSHTGSFTGSSSTASFSGTTGEAGSHTHGGITGITYTDGYAQNSNDGNNGGWNSKNYTTNSAGNHSHSFSGTASLTPSGSVAVNSTSITPSGSVSMTKSGVYGNSDTVTPPSVKLLPCMKI